MKSIKITVIFTLVLSSIILSSTIKRKSEKSKTTTLTKDDGSGSWETGYNCPKMIITNTKTNAKVTTGEWKFEPSKIDNMADGLEVTFKAAVNNEVIVSNVSGGQTYIPWRYIKDQIFDYEKDFGSNKRINFFVRTDSGNEYKVEFYLPWKTVGNYITKEQCDTLMSKFKGKSDTSRNAVITNKKSLTSNVAGLKALLDNQKTLINNDQQIIASAEAKMKSIDTERTGLEKQMQDLQAKIDAAKANLGNLTFKKDIYLSVIERTQKDLENDKPLLDDKVREEQKTTAKADMEAFQTKVTTYLTALKALLIEDSARTSVDQVQAAATAYNKASMESNFNKFIPA